MLNLKIKGQPLLGLKGEVERKNTKNSGLPKLLGWSQALYFI
jgi:hypothetical protein